LVSANDARGPAVGDTDAMELLDLGGPNDHELVAFRQDRDAGLRSIIAIHSTALGPALGGTRFLPYATEEDALTDVLRLSRAMSYKNAAAGLDFGGGKAVVIADPKKPKAPELLRAYAAFVDSLGGRYLTTEDVGSTEEDMDLIAQHTQHVVGTSAGSHDPSDATAWGVYCGMRAVAERVFGQQTMAGLHVSVQGVGKVGFELLRYLRSEGCGITVADTSEEVLRRLSRRHDVQIVSTEEIHSFPSDIFSPCALSGSLNPQTIPQLRARAVVGCANNQLATPECADMLAQREIVYAPDFIVNAGGVINIAHEIGRTYDRDAAFDHVARIADTIRHVLDISVAEGITTEAAAERIAEERMKGAKT
jgi:leucine dehydrogenase